MARKPKHTWNAGVLYVNYAKGMILGVARQRPAGKFTRYDWGLPGGHPEKDETPDICARREFLEETGFLTNYLQPVCTVPGIVTPDGLPFHVYSPVHATVFGKLTASSEGAVKWMTPHELLSSYVDVRQSCIESNRYILRYGLGLAV